MHYPTSEDLLNSLGLTRAQPQSAVPHWMTPVAIFTMGLVTGAAGALLLTPKTGRELRHDLRDAANKAGHDVKDAATWAGNQAMAAMPNMPPMPHLTHADHKVDVTDNHTAPTPKVRGRDTLDVK
jgi:hypothetical protein